MLPPSSGGLREFGSMDLARWCLRAKDVVSVYLMVTSRFALQANPASSTTTEPHEQVALLTTGTSSVPVGKSYPLHDRPAAEGGQLAQPASYLGFMK